MIINYSTLSKIIVKTQDELDMIPADFKGKIYIEFGTLFKPAIVSTKYHLSVKACGNSSVEARDNSSVVAYGDSFVVARDNSSVVAYGDSSVKACGNSSVEARDNSSVVARDNSSVVACDDSSVVACDDSSVVAYGDSSVVARNNSSVVAYGDSSVVARNNSSVVAYDNSQIVDRLSGGKIKISGNARVVFMPKSITEYCDFYGIEHDEKTGKFYKCVHKINGRYFSDHSKSFEYVLGKRAIPDSFDNNASKDCGHGIHVAYLNWALDYGRDWSDIAIIEVEAKLKDIVVPASAVGKIRCKEVMVLREVPLEECGLFGKILAKRKLAKGEA